MKKPFIFFLALLFSVSPVIAQKNFEGMLVYKINVVSKVEGISNATWKKVLNSADQVTVLVKDGNFKQSSNKSEAYVFPGKGKSYHKFKGYDTLYYMDVSMDTSTLLSLTKNNDKKTIAGYSCNSITLQTSAATSTYFYSPSIYMNPALTQNYRLGKEDVFYKETSSLFLGLQQETPSYTYSQNCTLVEQKTIDASSFELPDLPQTKFTAASFLKLPVFKGKEEWQDYLNKHLDLTLVSKYLKLRRNENSVTQTAIVSFMVSESGNVYDVVTTNKKEVHVKLAEEAMRVIGISHFSPATVFGEPIPYKMTQPITFQVNKE
jgi:hypothetical protein